METFKLTTGETINATSRVDQWASQCGIDELGMEQNDAGEYVCKTTEADDLAKMIALMERAYRIHEALIEAENRSVDIGLIEKSDARNEADERELIWNAFCDSTNRGQFRAAVRKIGIVLG